MNLIDVVRFSELAIRVGPLANADIYGVKMLARGRGDPDIGSETCSYDVVCWHSPLANATCCARLWNECELKLCEMTQILTFSRTNSC